MIPLLVPAISPWTIFVTECRSEAEERYSCLVVGLEVRDLDSPDKYFKKSITCNSNYCM